MTWCPNLVDGSVLATYGNYVAVVNTATGNYDGAWDFSSSIGSARLVGIAYAGSQKDEAENLLDFCLLLDSQGNVWTVGFTKEGDDILRTAPQKLTNLGFTTEENWYFSSIATDGAYLYASLWSGEQTDLVALDLNSGAVADLGNFGADVWPVVGLEVQAGATATAERLVRAMEASVMTAPSKQKWRRCRRSSQRMDERMACDMFKRIFSWLLVLALLLGMTGNVLAAESKPAVSQIVTMQNQEGVTVRLTVPGGGGFWKWPFGLSIPQRADTERREVPGGQRGNQQPGNL